MKACRYRHCRVDNTSSQWKLPNCLWSYYKYVCISSEVRRFWFILFPLFVSHNIILLSWSIRPSVGKVNTKQPRSVCIIYFIDCQAFILIWKLVNLEVFQRMKRMWCGGNIKPFQGFARSSILRMRKHLFLGKNHTPPPCDTFPGKARPFAGCRTGTWGTLKPTEPFHTSARWSVWSVWSVWSIPTWWSRSFRSDGFLICMIL